MFECQDVCRLCLAENNLGPIFSDTERSERYTTVLSLTTGLKIEPNDGLPQNICEKCTYLVNCALRLRNRSFICDTKLRKQKYRTNNEVQTLLNNVDTFDYNSSEDYNNYSGLKEFNVQIEFDRLTEENQDGFPPKPHEAKEQTVQSKIKNVKGEKVTRKEKRDRYLSLVDGDFDANGPVKCKVCKKSYCGKSFISSTQLKRHCRSYHGMRRELACKHCDYLALDNAQLALHERRVHTGERPFVCDHCGASYYSRRCLVQHLESHRDIGTVQCTECDQLFKSRRHLARHRYSAHARARAACPHPACGRVYSRKYLRAHVAKQHPNLFTPDDSADVCIQ
ncbi:zinc finger protein 420-like isoform X2 [Galleria mellonella]|uniref:Zinc finger protein 420-like isoform X2 n=1 Tax=Galleria mellonella TaxID=7137 RepID=A0ABM3MWF3_GALME|nr:zinc finger protein 420-like isoform X2 [Galleria mellonella]